MSRAWVSNSAASTRGLLFVIAASIAGLAAVPQAQPDPGTTFQDCDVCPEMVVVPAGSFIMGSPTDEPGRYDDEGPAHGNVWEWTADCWNDSYEGAPTDGSAWLDGDCVGRVTRGGAYNGGPPTCVRRCGSRSTRSSAATSSAFGSRGRWLPDCASLLKQR